MIRVLHLINGADLGGISSMILNYYTFMNKEEYRFDFVSPRKEEGVNGKKLQELGCKFYYIPTKHNGLVRHIKLLNKLMVNEKFDVVHVHSDLTSYVGLIVAWKNGVRVRVAHGHNADFRNKSIKQKVKRFIGHILIAAFATDRLACSKDSIKYTFGKFAEQNKNTHVLSNAIDISRYKFNKLEREKIRNEFSISPDAYVLGSVGRMSKEKNHIFLVRLMRQIKETNKKIHLLLVGDGDEFENCINLAKELDVLDQISFAGARSDISKILSAMDLFLLPSLNEGLGIVAIEASASGIPVILSNKVPSILSFIPESYFIELNEFSWVDKIVELSSKSTERMDNNEVLRTNKYDIQKEVKQLEYIYDRAARGDCSESNK